MPGGDRTGPRGQGPMTGKGMGFCRGAWGGGPDAGYYGAPRGFGGGRSRGWRHCFYATGLPGWARAGRGGFGALGYSVWAPGEEAAFLRDYTRRLEEELNATKARMTELEKDRKGE